MHVVAIASQKGGAGKSTFAANLATLADAPGAHSLIVDTDPQGSLSVWRGLRSVRTPLVVPSHPGNLRAVLDTARRHGGIEWAFIDAPPRSDDDVAAMMEASTLVLVPTRIAVFDLASVPATIAMARRARRPFFVVLNAVPPKRGVTEAPTVIGARKAVRDMGAPLWRGAVASRAAYGHALASGEAVTEFEPSGTAAEEMRLLWHDVSQAARAMAAYREAG